MATLNVPSSYETIQAALDAALTPGDIVLVAGGTYAEKLKFEADGVILRGAYGETVIVDGAGEGDDTIDTDGFDGGQIQNIVATGADAGYRNLRVDDDDWRISNVMLTGGYRSLVVTGVRAYFDQLVCRDASDATNVYLATGSAFFFKSQFPGASISIASGTHWQFDFCSILGSPSRAVLSAAGTQTVTMQHCIIAGWGMASTTTTAIRNNGGAFTLVSCLVGRNVSNNSATKFDGTPGVTESGTIEADPQFTAWTKQGYIGFGVDCSYKGSVDYVYEMSLLCDQYGQKCAAYVQTQGVNDFEASHWAKLADMLTRGHDVGGHSRWHPHMGNLLGESLDVTYTGAGIVAEGLFCERRFETFVDGVADLSVATELGIGTLASAIDGDGDYTGAVHEGDGDYVGNARSWCLQEPTSLALNIDSFSELQSALSDNGDETFDLTEDLTASSSHFLRGDHPNANFADNTWYYFVGKAKANGRDSLQISIRQKDGSTARTSRILLSNATVAATGVDMVATAVDLGDGWVRYCVGMDVGTGASDVRLQLLLSDGATSSYNGDGESGVVLTQPKFVAGTDITETATFLLDAEQVYEEEINGAISDLETRFGYTVTSWAWPHDSFDNDSIDALLSRGIRISRGGVVPGVNGSYDMENLSMHKIVGHWFYEWVETTSEATVLRDIATIIATLGCYGGVAQPYAHSETEVSVELLESIIAAVSKTNLIAAHLTDILSIIDGGDYSTADGGLTYTRSARQETADYTLRSTSPCLRVGVPVPASSLTGYDAVGNSLQYPGPLKLSLTNPSEGVYKWPSSPALISILGVDNAVYDATGDGVEFASEALAVAAMKSLDDDTFVFAGDTQIAIYSVDSSAIEARINRALR